ncbi:transposase [Anaerobutyricum soehngenii]|nr:transposase [Anaerobutyricum soehngenii]
MKTTKNYTERPKEDQVTTRQMFKIVIYAAMNHIYSSRDIETA